MKKYSKNTMKGFKPFAEIYFHKKKGFMIHYSCPNAFYYFYEFYYFLNENLFQFHHGINENNVYDTAKPKDRKKLNKKYGKYKYSKNKTL